MYHINLKNLEFYAYHGYYQEENLIGNTFLVDIMVAIPAAVYENENSALSAENALSRRKKDKATPKYFNYSTTGMWTDSNGPHRRQNWILIGRKCFFGVVEPNTVSEVKK